MFSKSNNARVKTNRSVFIEISGRALLPTVAKLQSYSVINNVNKVDCFHKDIKFGTILMQTLVEKLFY